MFNTFACFIRRKTWIRNKSGNVDLATWIESYINIWSDVSIILYIRCPPPEKAGSIADVFAKFLLVIGDGTKTPRKALSNISKVNKLLLSSNVTYYIYRIFIFSLHLTFFRLLWRNCFKKKLFIASLKILSFSRYLSFCYDFLVL